MIANYESLSVLTGQMREAAKCDEWDHLISLENQCSSLVTATKPLDAEVILDAAAQLRKTQLIQKILADHAEISTLTQAWMGELHGIVQSIHQEQCLQKAYGD